MELNSVEPIIGGDTSTNFGHTIGQTRSYPKMKLKVKVEMADTKHHIASHKIRLGMDAVQGNLNKTHFKAYQLHPYQSLYYR